jgi:hypothetical protein
MWYVGPNRIPVIEQAKHDAIQNTQRPDRFCHLCEQGTQMYILYVGLARIVYIHRIWPYISSFPAKNTVYAPYI